MLNKKVTDVNLKYMINRWYTMCLKCIIILCIICWHWVDMNNFNVIKSSVKYYKLGLFEAALLVNCP